MNYFEAFEKIEKTLDGVSAPKTDQPFAVQIRLSDEDCCGTLYLLIDDEKLLVEPYDYFDNDADILANCDRIIDILGGKLDFKKAVSEKLISISGNSEKLAEIFSNLKRTKQKKKITRKTENKKMANEKKKPQSETIKEVVEKEIKPKSKK